MPSNVSWLGCTACVMAVGASLAWGGIVLAEQPYEVEWITQIGTRYIDNSYSVAVDSESNIYISGSTLGAFDGTTAGTFDAFLVKYDPSGTTLWSRQIGTNSGDYSRSVAVDRLGNTYISGYTGGNLGGSSTQSYDAFLVKFDTSGAELWTRTIGTTRVDFSYSVAVDREGNAFISGVTNGNLGGPNAGYDDAFLTKFDPLGNELWSQQVGTAKDDASRSVAVDGDGNVLISGGTYESSAGGRLDAFLTKFDTSGNQLWSRQVGTTLDDYSQSVAVDGLGNIYISGHTRGSLGGPNAGQDDAFLMKFDPSGTELWSRQIGTSNFDKSLSVTVDSEGNAFISGVTKGNFGGLNAGDEDAFLAKFDPSGTVLWVQQIGTAQSDVSYSVAVDSIGNAYISGDTKGSLGGPNVWSNDVFLAKFAIPEPMSVTLFTLSGLTLLRRRG